MSKPGLRILLAIFVLAGSVVVPSARFAPAQVAGDFVTVQGSQLIFRGQPIKLKGVNFYPKDQAWGDMWAQWNGEATRRDLSRAQELGANSVRVLVPYKPISGWTDKVTGQVTPSYLNELQQFAQFAAELNMKVIVALFDFYDPEDDHPTPGSVAEAHNKLYLQTIISTFANDDRVLAWDLHNEPDQYTTWKDLKNPAATIDWLSRMAAEIRRLDHNHPLTVGVWQFDNLFVSDPSGAPPLGTQPKGRTLADLSDFLSFHSYNAGNIDWQIAYIKGQSNKPLVLQETGWPTGPACTDPIYSENQQILLFDLMVKGARKGDLNGLLAWQLWDFQPGASLGGGRESHEDYYGLLKRDGTWKPAMPIFRDNWPGTDAIPAPSLPSRTTSQFAPTVQPKRPPPSDPNWRPPVYFPETGHYIYDAFRDYWQHFGGLDIFGYPITEQRQENGMWVQYFERARFEWHPENQRKRVDWDKLDPDTRLKLVVQLTRLGASLVSKRTNGKGYPSVDASQNASGTTYFPETGHTISGKIAEYWQANNGLTNFGYPLSEPVQEVALTDGKTYTVQYFERTRLELHPEYTGSKYEVLLGLMGRELYASKGCK
jgi:hypothetical protein